MVWGGRKSRWAACRFVSPDATRSATPSFGGGQALPTEARASRPTAGSGDGRSPRAPGRQPPGGIDADERADRLGAFDDRLPRRKTVVPLDSGTIPVAGRPPEVAASTHSHSGARSASETSRAAAAFVMNVRLLTAATPLRTRRRASTNRSTRLGPPPMADQTVDRVRSRARQPGHRDRPGVTFGFHLCRGTRRAAGSLRVATRLWRTRSSGASMLVVCCSSTTIRARRASSRWCASLPTGGWSSAW